ncbi:MAG TPA: GGDEF domain-containing protein [Planctomycetota bacterium]|nr:GGDEF domain-containing protein [Planctomycetota bacterium]
MTRDKTTSPYVTYADKLPSLPAVALEVVNLSKRDWVDLEELADVIGHDPALAAKILKLSNSPLYGRRRQVATLNDAVMTLGLNSVKMAALSFSVAGAAGTQEELGGYDLRAFWRRALVQSVVGRGFCRHLDRRFGDEAFILGLLMDLSVPIFCRVAGEQYLPVLIAMDAGHPDCHIEEDHMGVTHASLIGKLMEEWGLPEMVVAAATWHHDPEGLPEGSSPELVDLTRIMNLSHLSACVMMCEQRGDALRNLHTLAARWFGQDKSAVESVLAGLAPSVEQLADIVNVDIGGELKVVEILDAARTELVQMSIATATDLTRAERNFHEMERKASLDALTGLNNRASFDATLAAEWQRRVGEEFPDPLGLIMIDVDHFKKFNDAFGHQAGDEVLRAVALSLRGAVRDTDVVCRYGGEEFAVVAPSASGSALRALGERLRRAVERTDVRAGGGAQKITASFGAAALATEPRDRKPQDLISLADHALYEAKRKGRNRVEAVEDI